MTHYTMLYKYNKHTHNFLGRCYFSLVSYILAAFLMKQLFHSRLLDTIWDDYSQLGTMRLVDYLISNAR